MSMDYVIAVDIGTQGTKAVIFDREMREVAHAFEKSRLCSPRTGTVWQEASDIYGSVIRTIRELMNGGEVDAGQIAALGIDSQMAGIMGIDREGEAVTVYDSWLDTRCELYRRQMARRAGRRIIEVTGGPVTYHHGPKILWWKQEYPDIYKKISKFVLPHSYVVGKLTGLDSEHSYFDYTALAYSGFGDNERKEWSGELLEMFGLSAEKFARIVSPFEMVGTLTAEAAARCGLLEGTLVSAGAGDTAASLFGAGMTGQGELLDCAGTASVLSGAVDSFSPDTAFETMTMIRAPLDGLWYPSAYINGGGLCLSWFRDHFTGQLPLSYEELEREAEHVSPGSCGVLFIPHFDGRVLPNNPYMKGSFLGLNRMHTRAHLYRAIMEGIAYEYSYYLMVLENSYPDRQFTKMRSIGGGARSELFMQIKADVCGMDVESLSMTDTALAGTAVIAGVGAGLFAGYEEPIQKALQVRLTRHADPSRHEYYQAWAEVYLKVMDALTGIYQKEVFRT